MVSLNKRTFWYDPLHHVASFEVSRPTDVGSSLAGVDSVVAAPILDRQGTVIAVLYGERRLNSIVATGKRISKLDAMLIELLASGVATGLARLEQERSRPLVSDPARAILHARAGASARDAPRALKRPGPGNQRAVLRHPRVFPNQPATTVPPSRWNGLNDVLSTLSDCVLKHEGVLVDYIGDELMAMWGAPGTAARPCRTGLPGGRRHDRLPAGP